MPQNQFSVDVFDPQKAYASGEEGYSSIRKLMQGQQAEGARRDVAAAFQTGDPNATRSAIARLMAVDPQSGAQLAGMVNNDRDFQFRQQESNRSQSNADRAFALQKQAAEDAAKGFDYREVDDGNGNKTLVRIQKATGAVDRPKIGGAPEAPNNPFSYGKMNESQGKDSGYANRMFQSEGVLRDPKLMDASQSMIDRAADSVLPGDIANKFVTSEGYQKYDQASRDFINATLRRESGAAISQSEFDNAYKQYLPRPGDSKELLAQKQKNRQATIASIAGGGGNSYKPPFSFGPNGEMNPTGNAQQGVVQPKATQPAAVTPPKMGEVREGYRYKGGNPADQSSWVKQ